MESRVSSFQCKALVGLRPPASLRTWRAATELSLHPNKSSETNVSLLYSLFLYYFDNFDSGLSCFSEVPCPGTMTSQHAQGRRLSPPRSQQSPKLLSPPGLDIILLRLL